MKNQLNHKKKILYIITKSVWGGAAKYVYDLATNLPKDQFKISVASAPANRQSWKKQNPEGKFAQKIIQQKIPYYSINGFQRSINPFKDILAFFEVLSLIYKTKPNVIHANSSKAGGIAGLAAWIYKLNGNKVKIVFTAHGWAFNEKRPDWQIQLIKLFSKLTACLSDKIICVSEYDKKIALQNKIASKDKLIAIHNGIDLKNLKFLNRQQARKKILSTSHIQHLTSNISHPTSHIVIGTIAEYTKNKGLIYLLKAFKQISKHPTSHIQHLTLVLIGSGENPNKEKIEKYIQKHQIKNIHLIEYLPNAAKHLKAFDIFVLPSLKEGLPYTIIEAMAAKIPIIATHIGGIPEILKPDSGILIKTENSRILAEKIKELIQNPEIKEKMITQARKKAEKEFSLEQMLAKTKQIY